MDQLMPRRDQPHALGPRRDLARLLPRHLDDLHVGQLEPLRDARRPLALGEHLGPHEVREALEAAAERACDAIEFALAESFEAAMNRFNGLA